MPSTPLPSLALTLLLAAPAVGRALNIAALLLWMMFLQWGLVAKPLASEALKTLNEIKDLQIGELVGLPPVSIEAEIPKDDDGLGDLRREADYPEIQKMFGLWKEGRPDEAYVRADKFLSSQSATLFGEWLHFFKADMMFATQEKKESPKFALAIEDYELALRRYPLSVQVQRALYQVALSQLRSGLFQEVQQTVARALKDYPNGLYTPRFILLNAEQALLSRDFQTALSEYSQVVRRFPRSQAAVDAAFRRAYLLFNQGNYPEALSTYENLEKYHSRIFQYLKMELEANSENKILDRILYAETLYQNGKYKEASTLFQTLGNLFPKEPRAALIWIRFGDTYLHRNFPSAALSMYEFVQDQFKDFPMAAAWARIKKADLFLLTGSVEAQAQNEKLLEEAFGIAHQKADAVASLALAKISQFYLLSKSFPKAQAALGQYLDLFPQGLERRWVQERFTETLEREILDHYRAGDYLASLTRYITYEKDAASQFKDEDVLLKLSQAARELELIEKSSDILNRVIYLESNSDVRQIALLRLVENLITQAEYKKAAERLRRFSFAYPVSAHRYLYERLWGDLYRGLKNPTKAVEHYERSLKEIGTNHQQLVESRYILLHLGELYEAQRLPIKAVESYERYLKIYEKPEDVVMKSIPFTSRDQHFVKLSQYRIADLYFNMNDFVKALSAYQRVVKKVNEEPFVSHALYRIGECYLALDDREAAMAAFAEVKSTDPKNIWVRAAQAYIKGVEMEVKYGIRIFN